MVFEYAVTIRAQRGRTADCRRALECVAFFPGVTSARVIGKSADSITIGYNGRVHPTAALELGPQLAVDGLAADGPLWETGSWKVARFATHPIALYCRDTWRGHFQIGDSTRRRDQRANAITHDSDRARDSLVAGPVASGLSTAGSSA